MPSTPSHQDPLQDVWRLEELTPDVRRRLVDEPLRPVRARRLRREGPGLPRPGKPSEHPQSH